ncbi:MAG TPA: aminoglycoside 3'-phosphotransferase [Humibacter sp.]|nr:aminoglycoside 3'-phosphotransferase [Humibacter sp.]
MRPLSGRPRTGLAVPPALRDLFGVDGVDDVVWMNGAGGVTVRGRLGGESVFAKWAPAGSELDLGAEVERLAWAGRYLAVPVVVDFVSEDRGDVLVTRALDGENAVTERWRADPKRAVRALGEGLRALHDALPVDGCPFSWSIDARITRSRADGIPERLKLLEVLPPAPEPGRLVVCHGDACAPNTLLGAGGSVTGYVDLGRLGVADRWADIAIGAWSTEWNYGTGYTDLYYEAYGIEPDEERIVYYRALWDAT